MNKEPVTSAPPSQHTKLELGCVGKGRLRLEQRRQAVKHKGGKRKHHNFVAQGQGVGKRDGYCKGSNKQLVLT